MLDVNWYNDGVALLIADDGIGFDAGNPKETPLSGHFGLASLEDRVETLQGTLEISSTQSGGTTLRARVPTESGATRPTEPQTSTYRLRAAPSSQTPERG